MCAAASDFIEYAEDGQRICAGTPGDVVRLKAVGPPLTSTSHFIECAEAGQRMSPGDVVKLKAVGPLVVVEAELHDHEVCVGGHKVLHAGRDVG